jgi:hypothetical protein
MRPELQPPQLPATSHAIYTTSAAACCSSCYLHHLHSCLLQLMLSALPPQLPATAHAMYTTSTAACYSSCDLRYLHSCLLQLMLFTLPSQLPAAAHAIYTTSTAPSLHPLHLPALLSLNPSPSTTCTNFLPTTYYHTDHALPGLLVTPFPALGRNLYLVTQHGPQLSGHLQRRRFTRVHGESVQQRCLKALKHRELQLDVAQRQLPQVRAVHVRKGSR